MDSVLESFARDARLSVDDPFLLQKFVAVHIAAEPHVTYTHMGATDYNLLRLNMHSPPLDVFSKSKEIEPEVFVQMAQTITRPPPTTPLFEDFCATFFPRPQDEEKWVRAELVQTDWRPSALLLCLAMGKDKPGFTKLARAIKSDVDVAALRSYTISPKDLAKEAARHIASMKLGDDHILVEMGGEEKEEKQADVIASDSSSASSSASPVVFATSPPLKTWDDETFQSHPVIRSWKAQCGLSQLFPNSKAIKQLVASFAGFNTVKSDILGHNQRNPLPAAPENLSAEDWSMLMSAYPYHVQTQVTLKTKNRPGFEERWKVVTGQEWTPNRKTPEMVEGDVLLESIIKG